MAAAYSEPELPPTVPLDEGRMAAEGSHPLPVLPARDCLLYTSDAADE